ncbi:MULTISPECIES: hypothetical protein [Sphingobium]|uniref:hypothetical protein n=1 Tax=Sphingobium TaxID=165695 RepID=UPI00159C02AC|nr:hypothetical protein [Sphingobium sp. 15-1]
MHQSDDARLCANSHERSAAPSGLPTLSRLIATVMQAFCTLHRIAWSAPWTEERR